MSRLLAWGPALILASGALLLRGVGQQQRMPLRRPLEEVIPLRLADRPGRDTTLSADEIAVVGMTSYLLRRYGADLDGEGADFSLYVGYYDSQASGRTIHSPRNCLPGAGWEPVGSSMVAVSAEDGVAMISRYLIARGTDRAVVLYWYQGRGRVTANEYAVKWELLRDAALRGRTEEALVRIVVPVLTTEDRAFDLAVRVARSVIPSVFRALPEA